MAFEMMDKLIEKGFPQRAFFPLSLKIRDELFCLGGICVSKGERIIYFPGATNNRIKEEPTEKYSGKELDHLTLEKDLKRWHVTLTEDEHIKPTLKTQEVEKGLYYWFSLNLKNLNELQQFIKNGQTYEIKETFTNIPPTHSEKRMEFLREALKSGQNVVLTPKSFQGKLFYQDNKFFHFSFFIDRDTQEKKKINFINPPFKYKKAGICTVHRLKIKENLNLIINIACLYGKLPYNVLYNWD